MRKDYVAFMRLALTHARFVIALLMKRKGREEENEFSLAACSRTSIALGFVVLCRAATHLKTKKTSSAKNKNK